MELTHEFKTLLRFPALSYDSDAYMVLHPFQLENICSLSASELTTLLVQELKPKIPAELSIEDRQDNRARNIVQSFPITTPRVDREGYGGTRGKGIYNKINAVLESSKELSEFWYDHVLRIPITYGFAIMPGICVNKNVMDSSLTKDKDKHGMNVWVRDRLLIGGEAKRDDSPNALDLLRKELKDKTTNKMQNLLYGPLKYIITIAMASNLGQFLRLDLATKRLDPISRVYNLGTFADKKELILIGINLLKWMRAIGLHLPEYHLHEEERPSVFVEEMTILKRLPDAYIKSFSLPIAHQHQWHRTYSILAEHKIRNTASYKICINGEKDVDIAAYKFEDHDEEVRIDLTVNPRGELIIPQTSHQLKSAITNILESLEDLYNEDVLHRDLRWPNIIFYNNKFHLIDFETAASSGRLIFWAGQPRFFVRSVFDKQEGYTNKDDIFQVGTLIGRALLLRDPKLWTVEEVQAWDRFADYLRCRTCDATTALQYLNLPDFPNIDLPEVKPVIKLTQWSVDQVEEWISSLEEFRKYSNEFKNQQINGKRLVKLDLLRMEALGIERMEERLDLMSLIDEKLRNV